MRRISPAYLKLTGTQNVELLEEYAHQTRLSCDPFWQFGCLAYSRANDQHGGRFAALMGLRKYQHTLTP